MAIKKNKNKNKNNIKLMNNMNIKKYNFNNIKSATNSFFITMLIFTIISVLYLSFILYYLNELKTCDCFQNDETKKINLNYLIIIESIMLFFQIVMFLYILSLIVKLRNFSGGSKNEDVSIFMYIYLVLYFLVYGYFIYYVYLISENIKDDCECSSSSIRYLLYFQTFFIALNLFMTLFGLFKYITAY